MSWSNGFEPIVRADVPLRDHTWYRLGGVARWFCQPRDEQELAALVVRLGAHGVPWRVLGSGANVVVGEGGFEGTVIHLSAPAFQQILFDGELARAGAGADFPRLIRESLRHGLVGLEALAGIPGTVGGLVRMNAGGRWGEIGPLVRAVRVMNAGGQTEVRSRDRLRFEYRRSNLADCIILEAAFALQLGDADAALARHREIWNQKYTEQPAVAQRSAGCVFKNPPGRFAGRLLDEAGLKGTRVGGAEISTRHANFIIAHADATADDVVRLIGLAKERVRQASGVELETEVEIW